METKTEKFYVISKNDGSKLHFYPLPGQKTDSTDIQVDLRVQCNTDGRELRNSRPAFTIFELSDGNFKLHERGTHYIATGCTVKEILESRISDKFIFDFSEASSKEKVKITSKVSGEVAEYISSTSTTIRPSVTMKDPLSSSTTSDAPTKKPGAWIDDIITVAPIPTSITDGFFVKANDWRLLLRNVKRQVNTLITGPAGTGKTSIVKKVADKLGLPMYTFDMGAMIDPISSLLGVHRLQDGKSIFDYAKFTQVIQKPCIVLLDELSRAPLGVGNILFPCLDDRRTLPVEIAGGTDIRSIPVHPEVTFIATANIGAEYTGTNTLDRALTSRFFPLELKYLPVKEEEKVLIKRTGVTPGDATLIVKVANTIRTMNNKLELSTSVSVRETLMVSQLVQDGWSMGDAMKSVYLPMFEGNDDNDGERGKVLKVLSSY